MQKGYDMKTDCWALGLILIELFDKDHPFYAYDEKKLLRNTLYKPLNEKAIWDWPDVSA